MNLPTRNTTIYIKPIHQLHKKYGQQSEFLLFYMVAPQVIVENLLNLLPL